MLVSTGTYNCREAKYVTHAMFPAAFSVCVGADKPLLFLVVIKRLSWAELESNQKPSAAIIKMFSMIVLVSTG